MSAPRTLVLTDDVCRSIGLRIIWSHTKWFFYGVAAGEIVRWIAS